MTDAPPPIVAGHLWAQPSDQVFPFHCRIRTWYEGVPVLSTQPTATASQDEIALTPARKLTNGFAIVPFLATADQAFPFQCSVSVS
jgi:hypothetical protein